MPSLKALQEKISLLFYYHGLVCASHPFAIISLVITIFMFMCYPLVHYPLPGNAPLQYVTPVENYSIPLARVLSGPGDADLTESDLKRPRWYFGPPVAYIQQIIIKAAVHPWQSDRLIPSDAYRASLSTVFELLEHIDNYQLRNGSRVRSLSDICLRVAEVTVDKKSPSVDGLISLLPEYNCLQLSPARLWNQDKLRFMADGEIVNTVYRKQGASTSVKDLLLGVPWINSGLKKYFMRNKQRIVSYAVTIVYRKYDYSFVTGLRDHLLQLYPLSVTPPSNYNRSVSHLVHIHYQSINYIVEYTPLVLAYVILCLYLYFSVRKIEMVKSKWGLAFSAMITVFASLLMSASLCVFFGLRPSLSGSEIFPYLVVVIGLENVLVVTKSVVSTPVHLEVKVRVAQGLQKEGWYIFKHLMFELLIVVIGFLTFVPAIQEFCLFAVFGLGSDVFLQMFFFTTVLSIDIRRMELSDLQRPDVREAMLRDKQQLQSSFVSAAVVHTGSMPLTRCPVVGRICTSDLLPNGEVSSQPGLRRLVPTVHSDARCTNIDDTCCLDADEDDILPMRMRLQWAQYRIVQRFIMLCVVVWIVLIVYKTGLVEDMEDVNGMIQFNESESSIIVSGKWSKDINFASRDGKDLVSDAAGDLGLTALLGHETLELWKSLTPNHWKTAFSYYNISLRGRYLTILPSVHLSIAISPDEAIAMRHPAETQASVPFQQAFWEESSQSRVVPINDGVKTDPSTDGEDDGMNLNKSSPLDMVFQRLLRYPKTRLEFVLTIILGIASAILWLFLMLNLYKCMCSRNYARWRSAWFGKQKVRRRGYYTTFRESVPLVLCGHRQEVECIVCDGQLVFSSCLGGEIRVWDLATAECRLIIDRTKNSDASIGATRHRCSSDAISSDSESAATPHSVDHRLSVVSTLSPGMNTSFPFDFSQHSPLSSSVSSRSFETRVSNEQRSSVGNALQALDQHRGSAGGHSRHRSIDFALASIVPDLTETIDTDFSNNISKAKVLATSETSIPSVASDSASTSDLLKPTSSPCNGYDFTHFQPYFDEHRKMREEQMNNLRRRGMSLSAIVSPEQTAGLEDVNVRIDGRLSGHRSTSDFKRSLGDYALGAKNTADSATPAFATAIWCLSCYENLVVAGCGNGSVEFWDAATGLLKYRYHQHKAGVIAIAFHSYRIVVARVNGVIDFLQWEFSTRPPLPSRPPSNNGDPDAANSFSMSCPPLVVLISSVRAHQHPINAMRLHGDRIVTASSDHTVKVYRVDDAMCLYTFHGHTGGVSTLCIGRLGTTFVVASGSEDTSVRLWDIQSGTCLHKLTGHDAMVISVSVATGSNHVVSVATDDRLCVWESVSGNLLHCLQLEPGYCNAVAVLTKQLLVTGGQGFIHLWDIATGSLVRAISLSDFDGSLFVRQLHVTADNSVLVCDYGSQLRLVRFTSVLEKDD